MKNYKMFLPVFAAILAVEAFSKNKDGVVSLTDEQIHTLIDKGFKPEFVNGFNEALANDFTEEGTEEPVAVIPEVEDESTTDNVEAMTTLALEVQSLIEERDALNTSGADSKKQIDSLNAKISDLNAKINLLTEAPEPDQGEGAQHDSNPMNVINLHDDKQLGGLAGVMFSLANRPYNQRARAALLQKEGYSVTVPTAATAEIDYERLKDDLGDYYRTQRRKELQSFLVDLPSVENVFPLESGYQDREVITNLFLGEFSQADSSNESNFEDVVKGKYEIQPEEIRMYDVMLAYEFKALKKLEKQWIGYLNKEGSSSIKLSFIEYLLRETARKLHNEREQRRMKGIRKDPNANVPGQALEAADGFYHYITKKINGNQIKPFVLGDVNATNIGQKIFEGTRQIPQELIDSGMMRLYMPSSMIVEYHKYNELHYGTNQDYAANSMFVKEYPDVKIIELKNTGTHRRLVWTLEGNIKTFEDKPGEMYDFRLNVKEFGVTVVSQWKEGLAAVLVGKKWKRKQDMDYNHQFIFASENDFAADTFVSMNKDDKTPSALFHKSLVSVANTSLLAITDIKDLEVGESVTLKSGSDEYGIQIAKSGKFANISAAWNPTKGDTITLMKVAGDKFVEVERTSVAPVAIAFTADATTPSLAGGTIFITDENSKATAITNFTDAVLGQVYTIHGAGSTNASTIANTGNFKLTAVITLSAGVWIKLVATSAGFSEVERSA